VALPNPAQATTLREKTVLNDLDMRFLILKSSKDQIMLISRSNRSQIANDWSHLPLSLSLALSLSLSYLSLSLSQFLSTHKSILNPILLPPKNINIEIVFVSKSRSFPLMRMIDATEYAEHNRYRYFVVLNFSGCNNAELSLIRGSIIMLPILVGLG